jgi:adenine-specific DNA-methyltransferase
MQKLKFETKNIVKENVEKFSQIFPNVVKEGKVDFEALKQMLSDCLIDGCKERYGLNWVGKREAILKANTPINKTLRPVKEKSVDFEKTKNVYIEGDNFEALKVIQESYLNKIKMIYIDPPYNTGKDFIYKDNFKQSKVKYDETSGAIDEEGVKLYKNTDSNGRFHSDWLSMMYERLLVARDLLRENGVIFISIDDNEVHNLRHLCDEVFGEGNFVDEPVNIDEKEANAESFIAYPNPFSNQISIETILSEKQKLQIEIL